MKNNDVIKELKYDHYKDKMGEWTYKYTHAKLDEMDRKNSEFRRRPSFY
ncbi:MAG: hypothetical protein JKY08_08520 [Flavobacteriaceae bacterium]|nr:hypothetical protein [Flavobacteriaceae bacterium]